MQYGKEGSKEGEGKKKAKTKKIVRGLYSFLAGEK
jgi:hypothetical protein